jgi:hypothetical protein
MTTSPGEASPDAYDAIHSLQEYVPTRFSAKPPDRLIDPGRLQGGDLMLPRHLADNVETARDGRSENCARGHGRDCRALSRSTTSLGW